MGLQSNRSLAELTAMKANEIAELDRLVREREVLERRLKNNAENIDFMKFTLKRRDMDIATASNIVGPWSVGFYSHDAD